MSKPLAIIYYDARKLGVDDQPTDLLARGCPIALRRSKQTSCTQLIRAGAVSLKEFTTRRLIVSRTNIRHNLRVANVRRTRSSQSANRGRTSDDP